MKRKLLYVRLIGWSGKRPHANIKKPQSDQVYRSGWLFHHNDPVRRGLNNTALRDSVVYFSVLIDTVALR